VEDGVGELVLVEVDGLGHAGEPLWREADEGGEVEEVGGEEDVEGLVELAGDVEGGAAHPPLPFPRGQADDGPVVAAGGGQAVEEGAVGAAVVGLDGKDAQAHG